MIDLTPHTRYLELFPCPVQISNIPDHNNIKKNVLPAVELIRSSTPNSRPNDWACSLYTTIENNNELHMQPEFSDLSQIIACELIEFAKYIGVYLPNDNVFIKNMWTNIFEKNCSTDVHVNPNSLFSGIYILKAPKGSAKIIFDSPAAEKMISVPVLKDNEYNMENSAYDTKEGQLIIFNSNFRHRDLLHTLDESKITLNFTAVI